MVFVKKRGVRMAWSCLAVASLFAGVREARADAAAFDLTGPRVEVKVTRAGKPLPISAVPNLQSGDRIWIHPDLPDGQSVHYLLVVAFLRGSTNPPPENWFTRAETWTKQVRQEGIVVTVPPEAQQALLFLAPDTSGGFATLRGAVRSKPGVFVRASQDLEQASYDRTRLDKYLELVKQTSDYDPKKLQERSTLLARTLNIKVDQQCFDKPTEQQASCLMQNQEQLVLDDGHSQSMVAALTSGPSSDLIGAISTTPLAGGGAYSPYVGAVVDLAKLMGSFRTAEYQYIPALALSKGEDLNLRLNNPPSFRNPKSVIVVGLPAIEAAQLPPLRPVNQKDVFCLQKSPLILPVEGAPLVFSTGIAHDFVLRVHDKSGADVELPARSSASLGGFVVDTDAVPEAKLEPQLSGMLRGQWGFESFDGPVFHLRNAHSTKWTVPDADQSALIVGREDTLHLQGECALCVEEIEVKYAQEKSEKAIWKVVKTEELEVEVPLKQENPGLVTIAVKQSGLQKPDEVSLHSYSQAAHLDAFAINAGDSQGVLKGTRLDEVQGLELKGVKFVPAKLLRSEQKDELRLAVADAKGAAELKADESVVAHVALKDGRVLDLPTTVEAARPKVTIVSKNIQSGASSSAIRLGNLDELPQGQQMSFFLKTDVPEQFPRAEKIEVATADESFDTLLSVDNGSLILQDAKSVLAIFDPLKSFGPSAFGALKIRAVAPDGTKGDWQPFATLVRIPTVKEVRCPDAPDKPCQLSGSSLFLLDSVASDSAFTHNMPVPNGYVDATLTVPRPNGTLLYIKLRDDPASVNMMVLPVLPE